VVEVADQDQVCQACGRGWSVASPGVLEWLAVAPAVVAFGLAGAFGVYGLADLHHWLLGVAVGSLAIGAALAWPVAEAVTWRARHPVVPGVEVDVVRSVRVEPDRRCVCGGVASCVRFQRHTLQGVPIGAESTYACGSCGRGFTVDSALGTLTTLGSAGAVLVFALFLEPARVGWRGWIGTGLAGLVAAALAGWASSRLLARWRHPVR
jgi:hypothetical protein